jgi:pilus assembly protein CpaF
VRVRVRAPLGGVTERPLAAGSSWIGRDADCEIRLDGAGIAPRHARLDVAANGCVTLVDLGSAAGSRVNGDRVIVAGPLRESDRIDIGHYEMRMLPAGDSGRVAPPGGTAEPVGDRSPAALAGVAIPALGESSPVLPARLLPLARRVHTQLVEQLDLRRRDVSSMSDDELRSLARSLLAAIVDREFEREAARVGSAAAGAECSSDDPSAVGRDVLVRVVLDEALGLGPIEGLMADDTVREIMINGPDAVFVERHGRTERAASVFSGEGALRGIVERIVAPLGRRVDESSPMVDARLPDGSRVNVVIAPLAIRGTAVTIRRFGRTRLTAPDLVERGTMDAAMLAFLNLCVAHRRSLLVSGGTGSGKTTLLNVLSSLIPRHERVVTIEDSAELAFDHPNLVALETRPRNLEGRGEVTIRDLVRNALRMRPDRIVVGECRGGEALDMLQAMNTGHDGSLGTVHANSPRELLSRLEVMVLMSGVELPLAAVREQIASSIHVVVQTTRFACGARRITRITEITGIAAGTIQTQDLFRFVPAPPGPGGESRGRFTPCGHVPQFFEQMQELGIVPDLTLFGGAGASPAPRTAG